MKDDDETSSDELDGLLDEAETLSATRAADGTEVRLDVAMDARTMRELEQRAVAQASTPQRPTRYEPACTQPDAIS